MLKAEAEPHQMNVDQLVWAGVPDLLLEFLKRRLHDGAQTNHGWPLCNQVNSLVIALMWLLSSESAIKAESPATRDEVMERIRPYVLAAFRYPLSAHEWYFSGDSKPATSNCTRGFKDVEYFGSKRTMGIPSAPIYAILCYFTRLDTLVPMFPLHLQRSSRALSTRSKSKVGPKREDVEHFINECRTRFESWTPSPCSSLRQVSPAVQPYLCGSLTGRWKGSSIVPYVNEYRQWQTDLKKPESMDTFCRQPLYITLREHFYCSLEVEPPRSNPKDPHSWLPASWEEHDDGIAIIDDSTNCKRFYQTRVDGEERPENIADVLITGQTDDPYAAAWGAFKVFGRVRLSDGLVFLRRESIAGLGTTLLRGYLSSSNNFAGRYRALNVEAEVAEWEAPFSLCKMEES
ncbi:hypothetical protein FB45DRAFT_429692 [Roridomyces roridus]|uniref:Uncharacterized protein n=1 Tax=Roridomyces roridus TaxID=1738132 RepID=A0AAD7F9M3_9AGAR|nr:hypothetical protein FB45DRAFT_429692 [Roridomyces roridus]